MTMKKIRQQLNAVFKVDLSDRKEFLAAQVPCLLEMHLLATSTPCKVVVESSRLSSAHKHVKPSKGVNVRLTNLISTHYTANQTLEEIFKRTAQGFSILAWSCMT